MVLFWLLGICHRCVRRDLTASGSSRDLLDRSILSVIPRDRLQPLQLPPLSLFNCEAEYIDAVVLLCCSSPPMENGELIRFPVIYGCTGSSGDRAGLASSAGCRSCAALLQKVMGAMRIFSQTEI